MENIGLIRLLHSRFFSFYQRAVKAPVFTLPTEQIDKRSELQRNLKRGSLEFSNFLVWYMAEH